MRSERPPLPPERERAKWDALKAGFGFDAFRPGQEAVIDALLAGRSVLAVMPTGAGKSLCYQVPAIALGGLTIVVSPLVALMNDQVAALRLNGVAADAIHSGREREANVDAWLRAARGETRLLYMAPERLMTERMLQAVARLPVALFAIDEAHCISQWGPAFRPEYADLERLPDLFPGVPIAAMTATADEATRADIEARLFRGARWDDHETHVHGFDRPNIRLEATPKSSWKDQLVEIVSQHRGEAGRKNAGIVYCLSRKKTEEVADLLCAEGITCLPYHAGLDADLRAERQDRFVTEDGLVIAATIAFGMGIDKADVRFVVHTDLPASMEAYYQEIGRAGRDGEPAVAHMLFGAGDMRMRRQFIEDEGGGEEVRRTNRARLDSLIAYAEAVECRRQSLLRYFGEETPACGNCDVCTDGVELTDGTEQAELVIAAVRDTGERYGQAHIVDVLTGVETEKVLRAKHDRVAAFGEGGQLTKSQWRGLIRQMVSAGLLEVDVAGYSALHVTEKGEALGTGKTGGGAAFRYRPEADKPRKRRGAGGGASGGAGANGTAANGAVSAIASAGRRGAKEKMEAAAAALSTRDGDLLSRLKALRLSLAKERNAPAYVIFSDKTLIELAAQRPSSREEFALVKGVGRAKLDAFAEPFLEAIREG